MRSRTIVGLIALAVLIGVGIYLLAQIPWEFGVFGTVVLVAILFAVGVDEPNALWPLAGRAGWPLNEPPAVRERRGHPALPPRKPS